MPWSRLAKMPRAMVKSLSGCWCWALDLHVRGGDGVDANVTLPEMVAWKHVYLSVFSKMRKIACRTWWGLWSPPFELASWRRSCCLWHRTRRCCCRLKVKALPIHHKTRVEVSRKWDKQYQVTFSQSWGCIPFHSMWDARIVELVPDLFTHTYQVKLIVELGEDSGTNIWCKMLARVNNVGKYSQIRKWNK